VPELIKPMSRYKLTLEYDGTDFFGWQRQDNGPSVQQSLEEAIFDFSSETTTVLGAGRTDSGVHALAQVAHIDMKKLAQSFTLGFQHESGPTCIEFLIGGLHLH
jgi:tRNA pseudouridine(38-40) synthase